MLYQKDLFKQFLLILSIIISGCSSAPNLNLKKSSYETTSVKSSYKAPVSSHRVSTEPELSERETIIEAIKVIDSYKPDSSKKTFVREYKYIAGEDDSRNSARQKAIVQLKIELVEEIGVYIESELNVKIENGTNDAINEFKQEIRTISAGVAQTKILDEKWDGYTFYVKAAVALDPKSVTQGISEALKSRANKQSIEELRTILNQKSEEFSIQSKQMEKIQKELARNVFEEKAAKQKLANLQKQLSEAERQLAIYTAEVRKKESTFKQIMSTIQKSSDQARKYVYPGMTKDEVISVAGKPRVGSNYSSEWIYGNIWVKFEDGVVGCLLDRSPEFLCDSYRDLSHKRKHLIR